MNERQMSTAELLELPGGDVNSKRMAPAALEICLVVSAQSGRAQMLTRAAQDEQWATIVCQSAEDALRQAVCQRVQLALIDLQSACAPHAAAFKKLVEQLATRRMLLAVCGKPEDPLGEVWSRQLGVWMYLPGVDNQSDIALLCGEARQVLEKLGDIAVHPRV